jgi:hypothetical protein
MGLHAHKVRSADDRADGNLHDAAGLNHDQQTDEEELT